MRRVAIHRIVTAVVLALLGVGLAQSAAHADVLRLRRIMTDELGNFTVLFSILDSNRDPLVDTGLVPIPAIQLVAGENPAEMVPLELDEPSLTTLREYQAPFRIYVLLPNVDLFNGTEGDENRPDAAGLRSALQQALSAVPERSDIRLHVGLYNNEVRWMPEYNSTQKEELGSALMRSEYVAPVGTRVEDPFNAIDNAYRTRLRRQAREAGFNDYVIYFIVVTSALTETATSETFSSELERLRGALSDPDLSDVITQVIVYNPVYGPELLNDPAEPPMRFAQGLTPETGTSRIVGTVAEIRNAMRATFDEAVSGFVLRFNNTDLETDVNFNFRMRASPQGGEQLESNIILAHINPRVVNYWKWIIIGGSALVGVVLITILTVYLIRKPKKEKVVEAPVVGPVVELCVQCGRALKEGVPYCPHCAAEPNYGLLKVLEGPKAGWTYFIRDTVTEVGKGTGNNIIIPGDAGISSHHLKISVQDGNRYLIEDLQSTNGTYIDNAQVSKQFLKNGDVITIGTSTKMKFTIS